ncbi:hypothetical protein CVD25_13215 [Bacillus canaveralius]|uniref:Uncharacterized protein n=1 Tax=Bacillus canaveralius TaxID=1403243 RepID=A0A2N5GGN8_9BACI|nr:hypothetical protein [Bacillus canaveralius]PLR79901.1 hypothetical protein CU635_20725 [Bacillus canaveralius]PLR96010.1 hypothetical protein CVD25_13215 [Bacillus canaveralius]RSK51622.1 hypothetical protein EJA13_14005 [Bacillus canaveralius]
MNNNENANPLNEWDETDQDVRNVKSKCERYTSYHVIGHLTDGSRVEGIIEDTDNEGVTMLVPEEVDESTDDYRQFGGYGGYGGYRRRFRRFRRRRFPYPYFVFPFIIPYPYYYPRPYY